MARTLKGERYLGARSADLAQFIVEELPFLDFEEATRFYAAVLPSMSKADVALLGCNDRFFLLTALLGRADAVHPWLYDRCREVEAEPDGYLDLWAREHYKSTIITFAGVIQEVMINPELTVGIFSHTKSVAQKFLAQIMGEFERRPMLRSVYDDVLWEYPKVQSPKWSTDGGVVVRRRTNPKEATVEAHGLVDGQPIGRHFALMVYDDVVTDKSVTTPEQVRKTTEAWELSDNLGAGDVRVWHIGTRYSFADTYGTILERKILKPRIYPATDNGRMDGNPVFISRKRWEEKKRKQRSTLAAQMLQNPLAGSENTFRAEWFRPWYVRPSTLTAYIMVDPSKGRSASSDRTAIAVVGIDANGNKYLLDGYRHRMTLSERWQALKSLYRKWSDMRGVQHVAVGYERYGMQSDDEYFRERMDIENAGFAIEELAWPREGGNSKKDRVGRLEPDFRLSRFLLPGLVQEPGIGECLWEVDAKSNHIVTKPLAAPTRAMQIARQAGLDHCIAKPIVRKDEDGRPYDVTRALMEEMMFFPFSPRDDLVDALSRIYDMPTAAPMVHEDRTVLDRADMNFVDL